MNFSANTVEHQTSEPKTKHGSRHPCFSVLHPWLKKNSEGQMENPSLRPKRTGLCPNRIGYYFLP
jgi:hypothetical protein